MTTARDDVLRRIRDALGSAPPVPAEVPRAYRRAGDPVAFDPVELFCEVVADYDATVPPGLEWQPAGVDLVTDDPPLSARDLDGMDGVLTGCAAAIAQTGTIVLDGAGASGRRAITLVPDLHLCVVGADQVVPAVPDAIAAVDGAVRDGRPVTFVSGPSATADIELNRVQGVHGPRTLDVFVVEG